MEAEARLLPHAAVPVWMQRKPQTVSSNVSNPFLNLYLKNKNSVNHSQHLTCYSNTFNNQREPVAKGTDTNCTKPPGSQVKVRSPRPSAPQPPPGPPLPQPTQSPLSKTALCLKMCRDKDTSRGYFQSCHKGTILGHWESLFKTQSVVLAVARIHT